MYGKEVMANGQLSELETTKKVVDQLSGSPRQAHVLGIEEVSSQQTA